METIINVLHFVTGSAVGFLFSVLGRDFAVRILGIPALRIKGVHLHHSLLGFVPLVLAPILTNGAAELWLFVGFSIGIIGQHFFRWGPFIFITKD